MISGIAIIHIIFFAAFLFMLIIHLVIISSFRTPKLGNCIVRTGIGGAKVALQHGIMVLPKVHAYEEIDMSVKQFDVSSKVTFKDGVQKEITVNYSLRIVKTVQDVFDAINQIGIEKINNTVELKKLFEDKFIQATQEAASEMDGEKIHQNLQMFLEKILDHTGVELNGLTLEDASIRPIT